VETKELNEEKKMNTPRAMAQEQVSSPEFLGRGDPPVRIGRGSTFDRRREIAVPPSMGPLRGGANRRRSVNRYDLPKVSEHALGSSSKSDAFEAGTRTPYSRPGGERRDMP